MVNSTKYSYMHTLVLHCSNGKVFLLRPSNVLMSTLPITTILLHPHLTGEHMSVCLSVCVLTCVSLLVAICGCLNQLT